MERHVVLGKDIFFNPLNGEFSSCYGDLVPHANKPLMPPPIYERGLFKCLTFCLEISSGCNLACRYCFADDKKGKILPYEKCAEYLDFAFASFPEADKYFIDLSGAGEPLLALPLILRISDYAKRKSDELRKEVIVSLVSNGTLLTKEVASILKKHSVLFGVSLDAPSASGDELRVFLDGKSPFEQVMANIEAMGNRDYVGVAATITSKVIPLVELYEGFSKYFKTISVKPVRSIQYDVGKNIDAWEKEYERLAQHLLERCLEGDVSMMLRLLNGDDYFGKFLLRAILRIRAYGRCDGARGRFFFSQDGDIFPCPALGRYPEESLGKISDINEDKMKIFHSRDVNLGSCSKCSFSLVCGGECRAEYLLRGRENSALCRLKRKLILLSMAIEEELSLRAPKVHDELRLFCLMKRNRLKKDAELSRYAEEHGELSFSDAKKTLDKIRSLY